MLIGIYLTICCKELEVSSAQPPAKKTACQIEIETFGPRFRNRPLLGFAFRNNTGKM